LYHHRRIIYRPIEPATDEGEKRGLQHIAHISFATQISITVLLVAAFALYLAGSILFLFRVQNSRGGRQLEPQDYSIISMGMSLPKSSRTEDQAKARFLQVVWFILGLALPLLNTVVYLALLYAPVPKSKLVKLSAWSEIIFAWSSAEVFVLCAIVAVLEIPKFGNGLIKSGCASCYVVNGWLLPELAVSAVGAALGIVASCWLSSLARRALYDGRLR
jgi:hypothetical protein